MGLLGHHISYTRSPAMHNGAAFALGINIVYLPIDIPAEHVCGFLDSAWQLGAVGFNVTTPHKTLVANLLGLPEFESINTLRRGANGWESISTDGEGFVRGLTRIGCDVEEFDGYVILGNGGAVSAILKKLGNKPVRILRRNNSRDSLMKDDRVSFLEFTPERLARALRDLGARSLLIQATNAPLYGISLSEFIPAIAKLQGAVCDLVYGNPSALVHQALLQGLPAQDGKAMLIEQARLSQHFWWGCSVSYEEMAGFLAKTS